MQQLKAARWLDLLAYLLQHRFPVTREDIFAHVADYREAAGADERPRESARRKFERDKDELRALGVEIETVPFAFAAGDEPQVGYRLRPRDFYLPYLEVACATGPICRPYAQLRRVTLGPDDVAALDRATRRVASRADLGPLAAAAASVRRKLEFDLPLPLAAIEQVLARPLTGCAAESLAVLQGAVARRIALACTYYTISRDREARREIEPYGLFFNWGRWYAVARARDRDALRVFRVDRMRDAAELHGKGARFEVPDDFDLRAYLGRAPWELTDGKREEVRVRFAFPDSRWVLARGVGTPLEEVLDDGGARVAFAVRQRGPFLRWLLTFRDQARVESPESVVGELAALRERVRALYAEAGR